MSDYKQREERVYCELPVGLGEAKGVTRDISASGIYFETDLQLTPGSLIDFVIAYDTPGGGMTLKCHGQILRIEQHDNRLGVAAKIIESKLEATTAQQQNEE